MRDDFGPSTDKEEQPYATQKVWFRVGGAVVGGAVVGGAVVGWAVVVDLKDGKPENYSTMLVTVKACMNAWKFSKKRFDCVDWEGG